MLKSDGCFLLNDSNGVNGCIGLDPVFAWPATNDFRLKSSSPAVNAAAYLFWQRPSLDLDGKPRLAGRPDMGCYELPARGTVLTVR